MLVRTGPREAAALLRHLLIAPGPYRRTWMRHCRSRPRPDELHQPAVCAVIAEYLVDTGEIGEAVADPARRIRDRVRRALAGTVLTPTTIDWFAAAFGFGEDDRERLLAVLTGSAQTRVLAGDFSPIPGMITPRRHRTVSVHEAHYLGPDGLPVRHRTSQIIEATDTLDRYRYMFDSDALSVRVDQGGHIDSPIMALGDGLFGVDVVLTRPLHKGETTALAYDTRFGYLEPPPPEFRRGALGVLLSVDLRVQFHPDRLPARVYLATWPSLTAAAVDREIVPLEPDNSVHRYFSRLEDTVVGFHWEWPAD